MLSFALAALLHAGVALDDEPLIERGSGRFEYIDAVLADTPIAVHYHAPKKLKKSTPILFVMHGMNRNADGYRDAWIPMANKYDALVLCPEFSAEAFDGGAYALGNLSTEQGAARPAEAWTFSVVERLFDAVKEITGNKSKTYYLYGHSAGGQFVHRMVLSLPEARIERAVAANAGWYQLARLDVEYPYGCGGSPTDEERLKKALGVELVVLVGEQDKDPLDSNLNRSANAMLQGEHRLDRAKYFYEDARESARELGVKLRWKHETVPGVGHNNTAIARPAAKALFQ